MFYLQPGDKEPMDDLLEMVTHAGEDMLVGAKEFKTSLISGLEKIESGMRMASEGVADLKAVILGTDIQHLPMVVQDMITIRNRTRRTATEKRKGDDNDGGATPAGTPSKQQKSMTPKKTSSKAATSKAKEEKEEDDDVYIVDDVVSTGQSGKAYITSTMTDSGRAYQCSLCGITMRSWGGLKSHIAKVHEQSKPHVCPQKCGFVMTNKDSLRGHKCPLLKKKKGTPSAVAGAPPKPVMPAEEEEEAVETKEEAVETKEATKNPDAKSADDGDSGEVGGDEKKDEQVLVCDD